MGRTPPKKKGFRVHKQRCKRSRRQRKVVSGKLIRMKGGGRG